MNKSHKRHIKFAPFDRQTIASWRGLCQRYAKENIIKMKLIAMLSLFLLFSNSLTCSKNRDPHFSKVTQTARKEFPELEIVGKSILFLDSIEVDVHLVNGSLLVGHDKKDLKGDQTLQSLYLNPLLEYVLK